MDEATERKNFKHKERGNANGADAAAESDDRLRADALSAKSCLLGEKNGFSDSYNTLLLGDARRVSDNQKNDLNSLPQSDSNSKPVINKSDTGTPAAGNSAQSNDSAAAAPPSTDTPWNHKHGNSRVKLMNYLKDHDGSEAAEFKKEIQAAPPKDSIYQTSSMAAGNDSSREKPSLLDQLQHIEPKDVGKCDTDGKPLTPQAQTYDQPKPDMKVSLDTANSTQQAPVPEVNKPDFKVALDPPTPAPASDPPKPGSGRVALMDYAKRSSDDSSQQADFKKNIDLSGTRDSIYQPNAVMRDGAAQGSSGPSLLQQLQQGDIPNRGKCEAPANMTQHYTTDSITQALSLQDGAAQSKGTAPGGNDNSGAGKGSGGEITSARAGGALTDPATSGRISSDPATRYPDQGSAARQSDTGHSFLDGSKSNFEPSHILADPARNAGTEPNRSDQSHSTTATTYQVESVNRTAFQDAKDTAKSLLETNQLGLDRNKAVVQDSSRAQEIDATKNKNIDAPLYAVGVAAAAQTAERATLVPARFDFLTVSLNKATNAVPEYEMSLQALKSMLPVNGKTADATDRSVSASLTQVNSDRTATAISALPLSTDRILSLNQASDKIASVPLTEKGGSVNGTSAGIGDRGPGTAAVSTSADRVAATIDGAGKGGVVIRGTEDAAAAQAGRREAGITTGQPGQSVDLQSGIKSSLETTGLRTGESQISSAKGESAAGIKAAVDKTGEDVTGKAGLTGKAISTNGAVDPTGLNIRTAAADAAGQKGKGELLLVDGEHVLDHTKTAVRRGRTLPPSDKLYLTGVEVAIATILTMSGAAKLRHDRAICMDGISTEQEDGSDPNTQKVLHRRTHLVCHGDTLQSIAEDLYQNPAVGWLIADMNGANIKEEWIDGKRVIELKSRQQLELPEPAEVTAFMSRLRRDFEIDQLVTVVSESTVDRELLNNFLGTVTGAPPTQTSTAPVHAEPMSLQPSLPALTIEMEDPVDLPVGAGIASLVKEISSKFKTIVKRPERKLRTAT